MARKSEINETEIRKILSNSSKDEILDYAYRYLVQKECTKQRKERLKQRRLQDEKNKY